MYFKYAPFLDWVYVHCKQHNKKQTDITITIYHAYTYSVCS